MTSHTINRSNFQIAQTIEKIGFPKTITANEAYYLIAVFRQDKFQFVDR